MPRMYTVVFENVSITSAQDFIEITPADDKPIAVHGFQIDQVGVTADAGDANEEFWRYGWIRGHTTSGSGGSSATPVALDPSDPSAGFSAEVNNTTVATAGTTTTLVAGGFNTRVPGPFFYTPETMPRATQGNTTLVMRLQCTASDAVLMSGTFWIEEV